MSAGAKSKGSVAEVTDDSCTVEFIEILPLDRTTDECHTPAVNYPVAEVKPADFHLQEIKQEPAAKNDNADSNCNVKQERATEYDVESACFTAQVS